MQRNGILLFPDLSWMKKTGPRESSLISRAISGISQERMKMITRLLKDTTDEDFTKQFEVNVRGTFNTMRAAATKLANGGTIINTSTTLTRVMIPTYATYVATKGAVEQLTRVFAKEMGGRGITVNAVLPGPTNTELFIKGKTQEMIDRLAALNAFNRLGEVDDIAKVIVFLASDDAKWISAQTIGINGAMA